MTPALQHAKPAQPLAYWGLHVLRRRRLHTSQTRFNLLVELRLMIVVVSQRGMNLRQGKVRMLVMHLFGAPAVRQVIEDDFNDLDVSVINPRTAFSVDPNMGCG